MKRYIPTLLTALAVIGVAATLRAPRNPDAYNAVGFGELPTLVNGRIKPLDTVARASLLLLQGRQRVTTPAGQTLVPAEWLLDMLYRPEKADAYQVFEVVHPDVLALLNLSVTDGAGGKRFSLHQLAKNLRELDRQAKLADDTESALRTPFQRAVVQLRNGVILYQQLQSSTMAPGTESFFDQLAKVEAALPALANAAPGSAHKSADANAVLEMARVFTTMDQFSYLRLVAPEQTGEPLNWKTIGAAWSDALGTGRLAPAARTYLTLGRAWQDRDSAVFNAAVTAYRQHLDQAIPTAMRKCAVEARFNSSQPFYSSMTLYVLGFLVAVFSWLKWPAALGRIAFGFVGVAFLVSTVGIATRMWLEARPPVTNLYSSALFVGWGAVALCLVLEKFYRNAIGSVAGGLIGFATLLVAHHLALGGDTLEMMRAVLDSNFWLATHVVTIAIGYSATFLAGILALIYVIRGAMTRSLDKDTAGALARMIYGIVCFATLFSFVGTILGGIWADQSWGRFWGWDPKENGALIIVIWNSIILHARWAGLVHQRGLAMLAIFGNIVTAWSWFGVNMLGVGLHSYGFMDSAFWWLVGFALSQIAVIALASLPPQKWRSFSAA
jgi:ABC-type transport system involved in cytochrome c biogenesis permease subunit